MKIRTALQQLLLGLGALLAACQPVVITAPTPTVTPAPSQPPTDTPVWFPPTATLPLAPTALPPTATPQPPSGLGAVLLEDNFSTHKNWQTGAMEAGNIAYGNNELTLAVARAKGSLISLREQTYFTDFYLEITFLPDMCQENDIFGVLFRVASATDFYRFLVSCSGQLRLERLVNGAGTLLQGWTQSLLIQPGMPAAHHLGIWAEGKALRFYIDNSFQFQVTDASLAAGSIGLYARSMGDNALTVTFSNLVIHQVGVAKP